MRYRNAVLFLVLATLWGSAFTAIKVGLSYFPPVLLASVRYDVAGVVMLAYALSVTDRWRPRSRDEWVLVGVGGTLMIAGYQIFLFVGERGTTSAAAAIIVSLSPILTTGFARVVLPDQRLTTLGVLGLVFGFGGVVVLSNPDPGNLVTARTIPELLVFSATASFALGSVLTQHIEADLPIVTMEAWSMLVGALSMHVVSLGLGESSAAIRWTPAGVGAVLYLAIDASAIGFLIYFDLLGRLGPIEINLVSYATPVAAAITGVLLLGEVTAYRAWLGFGLILVGFVLLKRAALRTELVKLFGG